MKRLMKRCRKCKRKQLCSIPTQIKSWYKIITILDPNCYELYETKSWTTTIVIIEQQKTIWQTIIAK